MHIRKPQLEELPSLTKLWFSLGAAVLIGAVLATTVILPAEQGIDPTGIGKRLHLTRMGLLKVAMAEEEAPAEGRPSRQDQLRIDIPAGQGQEIKMEMQKGFSADYKWTVEGGAVYQDTHGDIYADESVYISYSVDKSKSADEGTIEAPFGGHHGWYWKNEGDRPVTITLNTTGEYLQIMAK
ncbi:MAG: hypothetical protein ACPGSC_06525 [Granulosicoccaceae bacterium]